MVTLNETPPIQVRFSTTNGPLTSINHDRLNMKFTIDAKFKANLRRSRNAKLLPVSGFATESTNSVVQSPSSSPTSSTGRLDNITRSGQIAPGSRIDPLGSSYRSKLSTEDWSTRINDSMSIPI